MAQAVTQAKSLMNPTENKTTEFQRNKWNGSSKYTYHIHLYILNTKSSMFNAKKPKENSVVQNQGSTLANT
jgi:uncharacterized protein YukE